VSALSGAAVAAAPRRPAGLPRALYVHVPFCERLCPYCDFAVHVGGEALHQRYVDAVGRELERLARAARALTAGSAGPPPPLSTVFIGGGTPSLLAVPLIRRLLDTVRGAFGIGADAEVTIEANPSGLDGGRAAGWLEAGVTRVSLGVQSLDDDVLRQLGRGHDAAGALRALAALRAAGVRHLSCDLIYAVPGRPAATFERSLERLLALAPEHLSCYELTVEAGTRLHRQVAAGLVRVPAPAAALRQHWWAVDRLEAAGYAHYEVSNFARRGERCRHHLVYWRGGGYWAVGAGAHAHLPVAVAARLGLATGPGALAVRTWNHRSLHRYLQQVEQSGSGVAGLESVDRGRRRLERFLLGLRLSCGLRLRSAPGRARAAPLITGQLLEARRDRVRLTRRGQELLDAVAVRLAG